MLGNDAAGNHNAAGNGAVGNDAVGSCRGEGWMRGAAICEGLYTDLLCYMGLITQPD